MSPILADLTANLSLSDRQLRGDLAIPERGHLLKMATNQSPPVLISQKTAFTCSIVSQILIMS